MRVLRRAQELAWAETSPIRPLLFDAAFVDGGVMKVIYIWSDWTNLFTRRFSRNHSAMQMKVAENKAWKSTLSRKSNDLFTFGLNTMRQVLHDEPMTAASKQVASHNNDNMRFRFLLGRL